MREIIKWSFSVSVFLFIIIIISTSNLIYGDTIYFFNGNQVVLTTNVFNAYMYNLLGQGRPNNVNGFKPNSYYFYNLIDSFVIYNPTNSIESLYIIPLSYSYTINVINYSLVITPINASTQVASPMGTTVNDNINYGYNVTAVITDSFYRVPISNNLQNSSKLFPFVVNSTPSFNIYKYTLSPNSYYDVGVSLNYTSVNYVSFNGTFLIAVSPASGVFYFYYWKINTTVYNTLSTQSTSSKTIYSPYYSEPIPLLVPVIYRK